MSHRASQVPQDRAAVSISAQAPCPGAASARQTSATRTSGQIAMSPFREQAGLQAIGDQTSSCRPAASGPAHRRAPSGEEGVSNPANRASSKEANVNEGGSRDLCRADRRQAARPTEMNSKVVTPPINARPPPPSSGGNRS